MPLVMLDEKTFKRIEKFACKANISIDLATVDAVNEFMDMTGDLLLQPPVTKLAKVLTV
jgi:hypothetical protein